MFGWLGWACQFKREFFLYKTNHKSSAEAAVVTSTMTVLLCLYGFFRYYLDCRKWLWAYLAFKEQQAIECGTYMAYVQYSSLFWNKTKQKEISLCVAPCSLLHIIQSFPTELKTYRFNQWKWYVWWNSNVWSLIDIVLNFII